MCMNILVYICVGAHTHIYTYADMHPTWRSAVRNGLFGVLASTRSDGEAESAGDSEGVAIPM